MPNTTKNNQGVIIAVVVAIVAVVTAIFLILNLNKKPTDNNTNNSDSSSTSTSSTDVTSAELTNPTVTVSYGDYDAMYQLSKSIQNGEMTGKIVQIDGLVSHPGMSYSIVQTSADGTQKIGTNFKIQDSSDYPADEAHIIITGKVIEDSPMVFIIKTTKDKIEEQ